MIYSSFGFSCKVFSARYTSNGGVEVQLERLDDNTLVGGGVWIDAFSVDADDGYFEVIEQAEKFLPVDQVDSL